MNKSIYTDLDFVGSLFSQVLMSKLGVINDFQFEMDYIKEVTKQSVLDEDVLRRNYQNLPRLNDYASFFLSYPRKKSIHQKLFGY